MRIQTKYLCIYLSIFCLLASSALQPAQGQQTNDAEITELDQAQLDQMLAPIALYPDTLLSHILVASTYPLEVIQAARWRAANSDLDEQQALNAVEDKDWDPSVQALVPFNDLLQKLSDDLDWLQSLGSAFLVNEQQILTSVQNLRQKAYEQGNLTNNDYVNVEHDQGEIVIETVRREVVYVPYYDTRIVYGNWWWDNYQPYYWDRPRHSIFSAGLYWSIGFNIRPNFYFGGFHWHNRHVVANYHYRKYANRHWSSHHNNRQIVRVKEYPRWNHNQKHRRGVQYQINGQRIVRNINGGNKLKSYKQIDKQRVLNLSDYGHRQNKSTNNINEAKRVKQALIHQQQTARQTKTFKGNKVASNKQRIINQSKNQQKQVLSKQHKTSHYTKVDAKQRNNQKYSSIEAQNKQQKRTTVNSQNKSHKYKSNYKSSTKSNSYRAKSSQQNKSRPVKVSRQSKSSGKDH
ncbi:DUF3300 domain-containing protein [uncultured Paraglaciecola sp.]|uniref:DUF3300 domain-containing protein n=1 Tax=uncultured Paraglaciecola sp. TaxID=1765024 RepID=UPI0030DC54FC|tara:strand:- start:42180 stop:43562 length:1383 start_codon:yes stop_codon:yes gene_type:complete